MVKNQVFLKKQIYSFTLDVIAILKRKSKVKL
jgi:hypothetical protein